MTTVREVLVIGAAGKTGRAVTRALLERGVSVRAAVRPGSSSRPYAAEPAPPGTRGTAPAGSPSSGPAVHGPAGGTETTRVAAVSLDLVSGKGLDEAMAGVDAVYHLAPNVHPDEVSMAGRVVQSAAAAGITRFVFHSVLHPDAASMPHHLRKAEAEKVIRARLGGATVLRPAAYGQNVLDAALRGRIAVPYSIDAPFTNVDLEDVAEVAALVLTAGGHEGATHELSGAERLSVRDQAGIAAQVLGRPVDAAEVPLDEWVSGPGAGLSEQARADLLAMFRSYDREGLVGDAGPLRRLLGREPTTWRQVLERAVHGRT